MIKIQHSKSIKNLDMKQDRVAHVEYDGIQMLGVFDGHSGSIVAQYLSNNLFSQIYEDLRKLDDLNDTENVKNIIYKSCITVDNVISQTCGGAGSTCSAVIVIDKKLYIINSGDSKVLVNHNDIIKFITSDHDYDTLSSEKNLLNNIYRINAHV